MRYAVCALVLLVPVALADKAEPDDPKAPKARELKIDKRLPRKTGRLGDPAKATSAKELAGILSNKDACDSLAKQVDFKTEYVLVFHWSGSGGDRVAMTADDKEAVFSLTYGRTRDLGGHLKAFALPKKLKYRIGK